MSLHRLIYCSRACSPDHVDIKDILDACERNNLKTHVTGMLLFTNQFFLQLLEGSRPAINERFQQISRDERHRNVEMLLLGPVDMRYFEGWSMHYVPQDNVMRRRLSRYSSSSLFNPYDMSPSALGQLCLDFSLEAERQSLELHIAS